MTEAKESDTSWPKVETVETATANSTSPPNELKNELVEELEERITAKAWFSIFVSFPRWREELLASSL